MEILENMYVMQLRCLPVWDLFVLFRSCQYDRSFVLRLYFFPSPMVLTWHVSKSVSIFDRIFGFYYSSCYLFHSSCVFIFRPLPHKTALKLYIWNTRYSGSLLMCNFIVPPYLPKSVWISAVCVRVCFQQRCGKGKHCCCRLVDVLEAAVVILAVILGMY